MKDTINTRKKTYEEIAITVRQVEILRRIEAGEGVLLRRAGGFWAPMGTPTDGHKPVWHLKDKAVQDLFRRGWLTFEENSRTTNLLRVLTPTAQEILKRTKPKDETKS